MNDKILKRAHNVKLLEREYRDDLKEDNHIESRSTNAMRTYYRLEKVGINIKSIKTDYKSKLIKVPSLRSRKHANDNKAAPAHGKNRRKNHKKSCWSS